ncbi:MAG TPA: inner membrane CreD family protein [Gemmatimonadaceae bacterium]|nr:inner membrane CreD family protein [Gemmatimonadaceae bacterium]
MLKRLIAIVVIFAGTSVAWAILGATLFARTYDSRERLGSSVASTWGAPHRQRAPTAGHEQRTTRQVTQTERGQVTTREIEEIQTVPMDLEQSRLAVDLDLEHRRKGLLWYATYGVAFEGSYLFRNTTPHEQITITFPLPTPSAIYDDLLVELDGEPLAIHLERGAATGLAQIPPGETRTLRVRYRSQGLEDWRYEFADEVAQVRDFELVARTNFRAVDFPDETLSPTEKRQTADGWELTWRYSNLLSGFRIGITMPEKLQPGPLAARISLFAPVSLGFFFLLLFMITTLRGIELHPMNYFFLAGSFFAFHLLLAYLVDHISIHLAMVIASIVSIGLVVSYLRLVIGPAFAFREAALAQLVYLVLFAYAFFLDGFTGLAITIVSIATLFAVMQTTARVRWGELFARGAVRSA